MTPPRSRPTWRKLAIVALWGATTAVVAYLLSRGNLIALALIMVAMGDRPAGPRRAIRAMKVSMLLLYADRV